MADTTWSRIDPQTGIYKHYSTSIAEILFSEDVAKMWKLCTHENERVLLSLIWHTGARPAELLEIKAKDVEWGLDKSGMPYFAIRVVTKKLGASEEFMIRDRILKSSRPMGKNANIFIETIIRWSKHLLPEEYLLFDWRTTRSINRLMHRIAERIGKQWSPYHWRHSTMTHLAASGLGLTELQYWKGSKSVHSVAIYLHAKPAYIAIENVRKERDRMAIERKVTVEDVQELSERTALATKTADTSPHVDSVPEKENTSESVPSLPKELPPEALSVGMPDKVSETETKGDGIDIRALQEVPLTSPSEKPGGEAPVNSVPEQSTGTKDDDTTTNATALRGSDIPKVDESVKPVEEKCPDGLERKELHDRTDGGLNPPSGRLEICICGHSIDEHLQLMFGCFNCGCEEYVQKKVEG